MRLYEKEVARDFKRRDIRVAATQRITKVALKADGCVAMIVCKRTGLDYEEVKRLVKDTIHMVEG